SCFLPENQPGWNGRICKRHCGAAVMTCEEARSLLSARMDGELDVPLRAAVDEHVKTCAACTQDAETLESVSMAVRNGISRDTAPPHLRDNIRFALRGADYV